MRLPLSLVLLLLAHESVLALTPHKRHYSTHDYYVLEHHPNAGASLAECAQNLGVEVIGQAGELNNFWVVRTAKRNSQFESRDTEDRVLRRYEELKTRAASSLTSRSEDALQSRRVASSVKYLARQELRKREKRAPPPILPSSPQNAESSESVAQRLHILDPEFPKQWHLVNNEYPQHMMNVTRLWEEGITGKGVITGLIDDGLDYNSDDLAENFWAEGSYDYNEHKDLPTPLLFDDHHGTRCAGQIAAAKNNVCGMGIAYESKVAGLRILSGPISDIDESAALNYGFQNTSIYSCSWGPPDNGKAMEGPNYLIQKAMVNGIVHGRNGKGSVFVFASGNGGRNGDQCNFDGYTNSIFSVTVASVDYRGLHPDYSEPCAANMVVAYSSGSGNHIVTTDVGKNKCAYTHGGTSAAAPNAAGVFALALSVRSDLTWRDIQHLCVRTAWLINPDDPDWEQTAVGRKYSYKYGYGSINGYEFVKAAQKWELVKPQGWIDMPIAQINGGTMDAFKTGSGGEMIDSDGVQSTMEVTQTMLQQNNFEKLEHITVKVWITHTRRGDVSVELTSPNGVKSILASKRFQDSSDEGFPGWTFMTVKHWDENPIGKWTLKVSDQDNDEEGYVLGWTMTLWGSVVDPAKAKEYVLPMLDHSLPPNKLEDKHSTDSSTSTTSSVASTKILPKPTVALPTDHGHAQGEASKPAFPEQTPTTTPVADVETSSTPNPTPDEGWFSDLGNLVTNQFWVFIAAGAVVAFGVSAGLFFWRRAVNRRKNYESLPAGDDMAMNSMGRRAGPGSRELYDAFGEVSDDDDADEHTGLRPNAPVNNPGLQYHSGFLDDDDPSTAAGITPRDQRYRDEPDHPATTPVPPSAVPATHPDERPHSPTGSGESHDGSWEHASETR